MNDKIKHSGVVDSVSDGCVKVRIVQSSACSACKAASYCNASESKEKLVEVYGQDASRYRVGDAVTVVASKQTGMRAVAIGFGVPFVILVVVLMAVLWLTGDEPLAGMAGIGALVPYYIVVYLLRNRLRRRLSFWIE